MKNVKRKIKVIHKGENNIHIHNDLQNAAFYFKNIIESKLEDMLVDPDKADRINSLEGKWEKYCQPPVVLQVYEDMDVIWKSLFEQSGLRPFDTITQGGSSLSLLPDDAVQAE